MQHLCMHSVLITTLHAGAAACLAVWAKAKSFAQEFVFVEFTHAHNH